MNRGTDIRVKVKLSLAEIASGVTKKLKINKTVACDQCGGSGAKDADSTPRARHAAARDM